MEKVDVERVALADYMASRRAAILDAWRNAIKRDPALTTGDSLPRVQLFDHIPAMLSTFERGLRHVHADGAASARDAAQEPAAAHGLQRWQQGYDLREVTRELGKLNECVVAELDGYTAANPQISHAVIAAARRVWAALCSAGIELPAAAAGGRGACPGSRECPVRHPRIGKTTRRPLAPSGA
jgi:hypothetical protein